MDIENLPKNTDPLPEKEQQIFDNLYASVEYFESEKDQNTKPSSDTDIVVVVNKKKEIIKLILILLFSYDPLSSILLKYTKLNKTMFWICKGVLLLITLYFLDKKF